MHTVSDTINMVPASILSRYFRSSDPVTFFQLSRKIYFSNVLKAKWRESLNFCLLFGFHLHGQFSQWYSSFQIQTRFEAMNSPWFVIPSSIWGSSWWKPPVATPFPFLYRSLSYWVGIDQEGRIWIRANTFRAAVSNIFDQKMTWHNSRRLTCSNR